MEPAVNNLGVFACSPLCIRPVEEWLNFAQWFSAGLMGRLSTAWGLVVHTGFSGEKPVDKSVNKPWKDCPGRYRVWATGHHRFLTLSGLLPVSGKVKEKTSPDTLQAPKHVMSSATDLPPEIVGLTVDKVGKSTCEARGARLAPGWLFFVQMHSVVASMSR
ncbi:hypothetical protein [Pseudomonas syringae]|uniref:hypothetical protein n=1 Tax=Pseudomonas syringae TaxID=317 RepID=UPI00200A3669|nr:hypothetical protein [Pseudomonas syringae]MCK9692875.1 hypothetical protein [Pseudomonas syringae pv. syringae]